MGRTDGLLQELRSHVADALRELDGVVGLRKASDGTAPYLFHLGDDLTTLVLSPRYSLPAVTSLLQKRFPEARFGLVVRGCDVRALVEMAKREQIELDRLFLVGVACTAEEAEFCHCAGPVPNLEPWPDAVMVGTPPPLTPPNPFVAEYDKLGLNERHRFWQRQFRKCIKCYGCRNACPVCFCESCALENPLWVERGVLDPPFPMFHLIRAVHMASRCVGCRQCELACPAQIPLTALYDLIRQDVAVLLDYVPGADVHDPPPLSLAIDDVPSSAG
jgi:formate dehydrogenase subunit beta